MRSAYHTIRLGFVNAYLLRGANGYLLIDAGMPRRRRSFLRQLAARSVAPEDIGLIVITHAHLDHAGSLAEIRELCGSPVVAHALEASSLRDGRTEVPPGTSRLSDLATSWVRRSRLLVPTLLRYPAVEPDILVTDELPLEPFGFPAVVLPTPGHTAGSLSVLSRRGLAFVGDLASNNYPLGLGPVFNPLGTDAGQMLESWETLLKRGARIFLPGHGEPLSAERVEECLQARRAAQAEAVAPPGIARMSLKPRYSSA